MKLIGRTQIDDIENNIIFSIDKLKLENNNKFIYNICIKSSECYRFSKFGFWDRVKLIFKLLKGERDFVLSNMIVEDEDKIKILHQSLIKLINRKE